MSTLGWVALIVLAVALGFGLGLLRSRSSGKVAEMQGERDAARQELDEYRREVDAHFERTAQLFDKVTDDYRNLYDHLAQGARQLGAIPGESSEASLARPEQRRLTAEEGGGEPAPDEAGKEDASAAEPEPSEPVSGEAEKEQVSAAEPASEEAGEEKARHAEENASTEDPDKAEVEDAADKDEKDAEDEKDKRP